MSSMAFRFGDVTAFLCVADGGDLALEGQGRRGRLRLPHSCLVAKSGWSILMAATIPAGPKVVNFTSTTTIRSIYVDPCAKDYVNVPTRLVSMDDDEGKKKHTRGHRKQCVSPEEQIDRWMRDGVVEQIVRNIGDAPFLLHVFASDKGPAGGGAATLRSEMEAADAESWPAIRRRWERGKATRPEGVILVEVLKREGGADDSWEDKEACAGSTQTWGVVVQGWGADCAACYILNTCRVRSTFGFCTHFCLARARCFGDTADVQLRKAWLAAREHPHQEPQQ